MPMRMTTAVHAACGGASHRGEDEAHPPSEVIRVDRDERKEEVDPGAVAAAGEDEQREHEHEVDAERAHERPAGVPRVDGDEREHPDLVGGEPEHDPVVGLDLIPGPQPDQTEGRETTDHGDGQKDREEPLVALEEPEDRAPRSTRGHDAKYSTRTFSHPVASVPPYALRDAAGAAEGEHGQPAGDERERGDGQPSLDAMDV